MGKSFACIIVTSLLILTSCKNPSSENQGYDSGPTTEGESGSPSSSSGEIERDTTGTDTSATSTGDQL
jgi:hypothetical protein